MSSKPSLRAGRAALFLASPPIAAYRSRVSQTGSSSLVPCPPRPGGGGQGATTTSDLTKPLLMPERKRGIAERSRAFFSSKQKNSDDSDDDERARLAAQSQQFSSSQEEMHDMAVQNELSDEQSLKTLIRGTGTKVATAWNQAVGPSQRAERIARLIDGAATQAGSINPTMAMMISACKPFIELAIRCFMFLIPFYLALYSLLFKIVKRMPQDAMRMTFGVALCFFGGHFFASVAAIEAFRLFGWEELRRNLGVVHESTKLISDAYRKDDEVDEDGDGIADVDQIGASDLVKRKTVVAMKAIKDPEQLTRAAGNLWTAYMSVLATLRLQFARTTALALAIVDVCKYTIFQWFLRPVMMLLGPELEHWAKTVIEITVNVIAIVCAWYAQTIISSFYSAIRGGRMFADGLFSVLMKRDLMNRLPCYKEQPFHPDSSNLDDLFAYSLAAAGFITQFLTMYRLEFPLNIVFLPLDIVEYVLRWQIYFTSDTLPL